MSYSSYSVVFSTSLSRDFKIILSSLSSIFSQTIPASQVIVVVNGCSYETFLVFKSVASKYFDIDKFKLLSFLFQSRANLSLARNTGVNASLHDLIFFSDDDDLWHPFKVSFVLRRYINANRPLNFCLVHGFNFLPYRALAAHAQRVHPPSPHSFLSLISCLLFKKVINNSYLRYPISASFFMLMLGNSLGGGSSIVATKSLCQSFPFNEEVSRDEDRQFYISLSLATIPIFTLRYPLVTYLRHSSNMASQVRLQSFAQFKANFAVLLQSFKVFLFALTSCTLLFPVLIMKVFLLPPLKRFLRILFSKGFAR